MGSVVRFGVHGLPMGVCDRCGETHELMREEAVNSMGEVVKLNVCWNCSCDILNGRGDSFTKDEEEDDDYEV